MSGYDYTKPIATAEEAVSARAELFRTNPYEKNRLRFHRQVVFTRRCGRTLDIGSHTGEFIKHFAHLADEIVAVDYRTLFAQGAKQNLRATCKVESICADASRLPFVDGSFDTVVMVELIEHLPWELHEPCLSEAWRVLKPGGTLILSTPNESSITACDRRRNVQRWGGTWNAWDPTHIALYHAEEINATLQRLMPHRIKRYAYFYLREKFSQRCGSFQERFRHQISFWISIYLSSWWPVFRRGFNLIFTLEKASFHGTR